MKALRALKIATFALTTLGQISASLAADVSPAKPSVNPTTKTSNGSAYNGLDLAGQSIPVLLDRVIRRKEIHLAHRNCLVESLKDIGEQILKSTRVIISTKFENGRPDEEWFYFTWYNMESHTDDSSLFAHGTVSLRPPFKGNDLTPSNPGHFSIELNDGANGPRPYLITPNGLPVFVYTEVIQEYDELGEAIEDQIIVKDLKISYPSNYGPAVPMINANTQRTTSITVNMEKFATCLTNTLQHPQP